MKTIALTPHRLIRPVNAIAKFVLTRIAMVVFASMLSNSALAQSSTDEGASEEVPVNTVYPDWFKTSFMELEEDILEAQEAGKRLMLIFHQPGCPYCDALVERNLSQKDIEETVKTNFDVLEINMWGDLEVVNVDGTDFTEKTFAEYLEVQFTPTVLMYHSDGSIAMRINGYFPPDKFRAALDYVMKEDTDKQSFNEYLASLNTGAVASSQTSMPGKHDYIKHDDFNTDATISLPAADQDRPYVFLFEQNDCGNCEQLHSTVLTDENILETLGSFDMYRFDMWGRDTVQLADGTEVSSRELAKQFEINYAPTLLIFSADHKEVIRSESWLRRFHTQTMLDYTLTEAWKEQPSFQRFIRARADEIRESGGTVSILK